MNYESYLLGEFGLKLILQTFENFEGVLYYQLLKIVNMIHNLVMIHPNFSIIFLKVCLLLKKNYL